MAWTTGALLAIHGTYWYQEPRNTIIKELDDVVYRALENFSGHNNGQFPSHIIVHRSGISEGEYAKV